LWGAVGLAHDFEYDRFPDEHPFAGGRILREMGYSDPIVNAVLSHGETGVPRDTLMSKALYAVDELTGLLVAVTLVHPSKDIREVKIKSVKKKWKDKAFAAAVSRDEIEAGAKELGVELWEHISIVLEAMQDVASEIGLDGQMAQS
jgi:predicted hydrolase (HD superfamily)